MARADETPEDQTQERDHSEDAREADLMGEKPDLGHERDALNQALSGSGVGSDTRAGSLRGGSVSGSDIEPDQVVINEALAREGRASAAPRSPSSVDPSDVKNTGPDAGKSSEGPAGADAATG